VLSKLDVIFITAYSLSKGVTNVSFTKGWVEIEDTVVGAPSCVEALFYIRGCSLRKIIPLFKRRVRFITLSF